MRHWLTFAVFAAGCHRLLEIEKVAHVDASVAPEIDASPDAFVFDPSLCPTEYDLTLSTGRYRVITEGATAAAHVTDCDDDLPGGTHLVSLEDGNEAALLHAALPFTPSRYYVGAFQSLDSGSPDVNWRVVTGGPLPANLWDGASPDDADTLEDGDENFAAIYTNAAGATFLYDDAGGLVFAAVCECDGLPVVVTPPR